MALPPLSSIRFTSVLLILPASTMSATSTASSIRHAHAVDERAFLAHFAEHIGDLRPAAVHQHDLHADQLQQADIADDGILQVLGDHGVAAVFDDDDLAAVILNIRQRVNQNPGPLCICDIHAAPPVTSGNRR